MKFLFTSGSRLLCLLAVLSWPGPGDCASPTPPSLEDTVAIGKRVADSQLFSGREWIMPTKEPRVWKNTEWGATALWVGVLEFYKLTQDKRYLDALMAMGKSANWQPQGHSFNADMHAIGQIYLDIYALNPNPEMIAPIKSLMDEMSARKDAPVLDNAQRGSKVWWSWSDSLFMSPPILFHLAQETGERKYFDYADKNWWLTVDQLYDPQERLLYRDSTSKKESLQNGRKVFWARGDGWVFASLARILPMIPKDAPSRPRYEKLFREMALRLTEIQQPEGFWTSSLLDHQSFPQGETSGTAFFCYGLAWGLNQGILQGQVYRQAAQRSWQWLRTQVQPDGVLIGVQPVGSAPAAFNPSTSEVYGVGAFLLATCEMNRLLNDPKAKPVRVSSTQFLH